MMNSGVAANDSPCRLFLYFSESFRYIADEFQISIVRAKIKDRMSANGQSVLPAYQKIQGSIRERIDAGDLKPGDAVASERELARLHRVSLMTARHALAGLEREGIVERRRGAGTFVAPPRI